MDITLIYDGSCRMGIGLVHDTYRLNTGWIQAWYMMCIGRVLVGLRIGCRLGLCIRCMG